jgi:hypothetical protein
LDDIDTQQKDKLSNFDIFVLLRNSQYISPEKRNAIEGAVIITAPLVQLQKSIVPLSSETFHDPRYKRIISTIIRDTLWDVHQDPSSIDSKLDLLLEGIDTTVLPKIEIKGHSANLYTTANKFSVRYASSEKRQRFFQSLGRYTDLKFRKFYENHGYSASVLERTDLKKVLRSEYEYFNRVAHRTLIKGV